MAGFGFGTNRRTLTLVLRMRKQFVSVVEQILSQVKEYVQALAFESNYLQHFTLVIFNNHSFVQAVTYRSVVQLEAAIRGAIRVATSDGGCYDSVFTAALEGLLNGFVNNSPVYVITDAVPDDESQAETLNTYNSLTRTPIYFIYVQQTAGMGCSGDAFQSGYRAMTHVAERSAGNVFNVPNVNAPKTGELFYKHLRQLFYRSNLLQLDDAPQCGNQMQYQPTAIDVTTHEVTVTAVGTNLQIEVSDPDNHRVKPTSSYQLNDTYIWTISGVVMGQWFFKVKSAVPTTMCSYRIHSTKFYFDFRGEYDLFWGFTPLLILDSPSVQPLAGLDNSLVAHINNYKLEDHFKTFAELTVRRTTTAGTEIVHLSNGIWRDGCSFELYFPTMQCLYPGEIIYFTIYIRDHIGFMIQRSSVAYCASIAPTPEPVGGCQNGGVPITMPDNTTVCYCTPDYIGEHCQTLVCHNGGVLTTKAGMTYCQCPPGFIGEGCDTVSCIEPGQGEPFNPTARSMAFVIEMTDNAITSVKKLVDYLPSLIRDFALHHPQWITNYILVGYNSTWSGVLCNTDEFGLINILQAAIAAYEAVSKQRDKGCNVRVWHALEETLNLVKMDSYITVLHASASETGEIGAQIAAAAAVRQKRTMVNVFYAYKASASGGSLLCNATSTHLDLLGSLCDINGGRAYPFPIGNFFEAIQIVPNYYLSALVYVRQLPECQYTKPMSKVYFPIDSFTQSIQINARGYKHKMTIYRADGTVVKNIYPIVNDADHAGWSITQVRKTCDNGWEELHDIEDSPYCVLFVLTEPKTWLAAREFCESNEGFLIDELHPDKDAWLESKAERTNFWIGLSDWGDVGTFYWDSPIGSPFQPFNATSFTNWAPNEPSDDPNKRCVARRYVGQTGKAQWYVRNCSEVMPFVCEKHKYDQTMQPNDITDAEMPPGKWYLEISSEKPPAGYTWDYTGCEVEIRVQSKIQVFPGFALDIHNDVPDMEATSGSTANRFITHMYGGDGIRPALLSYANLYEANTMSMEAAATYQQRRGCTYPWLSQTWQCPNYDNTQNKFAVIHSGEDQFGLNFQRMSTGHCRQPITDCSNGGIAYNGSCVCMDLWMGKKCEIANCQNGGTRDDRTMECVCPKGWTGFACQFDQCLPKVPVVFSFTRKSFVLVVEMTQPFSKAVRILGLDIGDIIAAANLLSQEWFTNYILVPFDSKNVMPTVVTTSADQFVDAVKKLTSQIVDNPTKCGAPLFKALGVALSVDKIRSPGSVVFLVTRSIATDFNVSGPGFMDALSRTKAKLNYMVVDDSEKVCGYNPDDPRVKELAAFTLASGGNVFIQPSNLFTHFLDRYITTMFQETLLTTPTLLNMNCESQQWFAQVDTFTTMIYLTVFSTTGALTVLDPRGDVLPLITHVAAGKTRFMSVTSNGPGIYTIKMHSPVSCMVQVRGNSDLIVYTGFLQPKNDDNGAHNDDVTADPVAGVDNVVALHIDGTPSIRARLTYVELINQYDDNIITSQLYRRQNCSYEFYSKPFRCPDQIFLVMVNGVDEIGQNFRREVAIAYCVPAATNIKKFERLALL